MTSFLDPQAVAGDFNDNRRYTAKAAEPAADLLRLRQELDKMLEAGRPTSALDQPVTTVREVLEVMRRFYRGAGGGGGGGEVGPAGPEGPQGPQGDTGPAGADGADGQGVPAGGTAGQILEKIDGTDYNTQWADPAAGGSQNLWETITSDSGSAVANTTTDTLTIAGGEGISTAISGDTLTITNSGGYFAGAVFSTGAATSGSTHATKGSFLIPSHNLRVTVIKAHIDQTATTETYKYVICRVDSDTSGIIQDTPQIGATAQSTGDLDDHIVRFALDSPYAMTAGNTYFIGIVRTDSTSTAVNHVTAAGGSDPLSMNAPGVTSLRRGDLDSLTPANGNTLTTAANPYMVWPEGFITG